jgi:Protein of unknown function (DUF3073)
MGRGRAKAKQTKVARELKYHSPNTDLAALQRELGGRASSESDDADYADNVDDAGSGDEDDDLDGADEASDGDNWASGRR